MYKEIEIEVVGHGGKTHTQFINISNINYYRPFVESSSKMGEKPKLVTMVYFQGSVKATQVNCSAKDFQAKIKEINT